MANGPTNAPVASAGPVDFLPQVSIGSQPDHPRRIGFTSGPVATIPVPSEPAQNVLQNVLIDVPVAGAGNSVQNAPEDGPENDGLPALPGVQWEQNARGGWEAWHVPPGAVRRADKTYLGYVGVRKLAGWKAAPDFAAQVAEWIAAKREEKGIPLSE